jgi:hypothetical protein
VHGKQALAQMRRCFKIRKNMRQEVIWIRVTGVTLPPFSVSLTGRVGPIISVPLPELAIIEYNHFIYTKHS